LSTIRGADFRSAALTMTFLLRAHHSADSRLNEILETRSYGNIFHNPWDRARAFTRVSAHHESEAGREQKVVVFSDVGGFTRLPSTRSGHRAESLLPFWHLNGKEE